MPGDERDEIGSPDDGRGQAKPPPLYARWVEEQTRAMEAAHKRIAQQWAAMIRADQ